MSWKKHLSKKRVAWSCAAIAAVAAVPIYNASTTKAAETRYVLAAVQTGTVVSTLAGSGQVSAEQTVDLKPKVSGDIITLLVKANETVHKDQTLIEIDRGDAVKAVRDAQQSVRDAELSLQSSQLSYQKQQKGPSTVSLLQAQDSLRQAQRNLDELTDGPDAYELQQAEAQVTQAEQSAKLAADGTTPQVVRNAYDKAAASLKNLASDLSNALGDADSVLGIDNSVTVNTNFAPLFSVLDQGKKNLAINSYPLAKQAITNAKTAVDALTIQNENPAEVDAAIDTVQATLDVLNQLLLNVKNGLDASLTSSSFSQSSLDQLKSTIQGDITSVTNNYSTLLSLRQSIDQARDSYNNSALSLAQAKASLQKLKDGATASQIASAQEQLAERKQALTDLQVPMDAIDAKIAENGIAQRRSALQDAKNRLTDASRTLSDYSVRAPFDGVIAKVNVQPNDAVSGGAAAFTIITNSKIAVVPLNEVDVAKVKVGQKATLTFDAIDTLTMTGEVAEIATLGTTSQGVVNYDVKILFDTQDERIRPGMSVGAAIILDSAPDVLTVPNAAIKTSNGESYVQVLDTPDAPSQTAGAAGVTSKSAPRNVSIETGLASDSVTQVTTGLKEGEMVVTQTVVTGGAKTATTATTNRNATAIPGLGGRATGFTSGGQTFQTFTR
ncbi:MAG: efflux RND transporter periplasmic adaptor subunit [Patescibacteria group bacterium]